MVTRRSSGMLPSGIQEVRTSRALAFAAPDVEAWVRGVLERGERLHEAATREAERVLRGRGAVPVVRTQRGVWVVRRYRRGGRVAWLGERSLRGGMSRPIREARASGEVRRRGIPTPRVVGGAVYRTGAFYRADLVTEFVPGSVDLARLLFEEEHTEREREDALIGVGRLLARTAAAGVEHRDLNAKNILMETIPGGAIPLLLDLDRCRVLPAGERGEPMRMFTRLARSLRKLEDGSLQPIADAEWAALTDAALLRSGV
jgi:3-deoxy-D-manno-octulosonic acid kinase